MLEEAQQRVVRLRSELAADLRKPSGGVRGIMVSDVFRRLVARTLDQQFAKKAEPATAPFQYALSTRACCECVSHALSG